MLLPARRSLLAALLAPLLAAACDETFQPIEPNDVKFSVFGFLDASADTQWVRVMPLRSLVTTSPEPLAARVTLEHLGTGRVIELRDSVFRFGAPDDVGSEGRFLHNFWTAERLEPGASYRFSAVRGGEEPSEAVVSIPRDFQTEVWIRQGTPLGDDLFWLGGVRHVAFTAVTTHFYDGCGPFVARTLFPHTSADAEVQTVAVSSRLQSRGQCGAPVVEKRELSVAASGAPWPTGREYQTSRLGSPDDSSSISGSVGFLGGVLTRVVPYESCQLLGTGPATDYCKLRYDASSATLLGRTLDAFCDAKPVPNVVVRLREIDARPGERPKLRPLLSTRAGVFEIGALEAGRRYELILFRLDPVPPPAFEFQEYADTLEFAPGERRSYDALLKRVNPCPVDP